MKVNVANGNLLVQAADVIIDPNDPSNVLGRAYNSRSTEVGDFGKGWRMTTGAGTRLVVDGAVADFVDGTGYTMRFVRQPDGTWVAEPDAEVQLSTVGGIPTIADEASDSLLEFAPDGRLVTLEDDLGARFEHEYTSAGGRTVWSALRYPDGRTVRSSRGWNGTNVINQFDDPASRHYTYAYGGDRLLLSATTPDGVTTYGYDSVDRLNEISSPTGDRWDIDYDASGRVTSYEFTSAPEPASSFTVSLDYQPDGSCPAALNQTTVTFPGGETET